MAGPWEDYAAPQQQTEAPPWQDYQPTGPKQNLPMQPWSGSVLPVSSDSEGNLKFDPTAGLLGALWSQATLPRDVATGNAQLPSGPPGTAPTGPTTVTPGLLTSLFGIQTKPIYDDSGPAFNRAMDLGTSIATAGGGPVQRVRSAVAGDIPAPSLGALREAADNQYAAARGSGASYYPSAVGEVVQNARNTLENRGLFPENAPQAHGLLNRLENVPQDQPVPVSRIDAIRQGLGNISPGPDTAAAPVVRRAIDDFISNPPQGSVAGGNAQQAADAYRAARGDAAAAFRAQDIENLGASAADRATATNSGQNVGNLIRGRVATLLDPNHPERLAGYSAEEVAALRSVLEGGPLTNIARFASNVLGGGGGLGSLITTGAGAAAGGPWGAMAAPTAGLLFRNTANRATEQALAAASELVRQRSPSYQGLLAQAAPVPVLPAGLLGRTGMLAGQTGLIDYLHQRDRQTANQ